MDWLNRILWKQQTIILDSVYLYYLKLSGKYLVQDNNDKEDTYMTHLNNIAVIITGKIKNNMLNLNIQVEEITNIGLMHVIANSFSDELNQLYTKNYIINIGTEKNETLIAIEITDAENLEQSQGKRKSKQAKN
ncbi:hypothetical protein ABPG74_019066 [Tetrahymena malaccensis]